MVRARLERILLRRKDNTPSLLSASRAPASDALAAANYVETHAQAPVEPTRLPDVPQTLANALPDVPALHTYKGDVASTIQEQKVSLAAIAQAEAMRSHSAAATEPKSSWMRSHTAVVVELSVGALLFLGAIGALTGAYLRTKPVTPVSTSATSVIYAEKSGDLRLPENADHAATLTALRTAAQDTKLPLGLIMTINLTVTGASKQPVPVTTEAFLARLAPKAPDGLVRALDARFLFGLYGLGENKPFFIFTTDAYDQVYAGMLEWEYSLPYDLGTLLPKLNTVLTSNPSVASSSTTPAQPVIKTLFTDAVLNNHDTRAIRDGAGNVILLWSFVDRRTLVITTDAATLTEIASRLQKAPTVIAPN
jgi:hypothetical protein